MQTITYTSFTFCRCRLVLSTVLYGVCSHATAINPTATTTATTKTATTTTTTTTASSTTTSSTNTTTYFDSG